MSTDPYLGFNGNCAEAFRFYAQVLGGKIEALVTYGETPDAENIPPDQRDRTVYARLNLGGSIVLGGDAPADCYEKPAGFSLCHHVDTPEEVDRIFHALEEGGRVTMPLQKTFFASRFGMCEDRFGTPWMIICEAEG